MGFGMDLALIWVAAMVVGGGCAGGLCTTWVLHRRTYRLENRVEEVEAQVLSVRQKAKSVSRWEKQKDVDAELAEFMKTHKGVGELQRRRYDNDPLDVEASGFSR